MQVINIPIMELELCEDVTFSTEFGRIPFDFVLYWLRQRCRRQYISSLSFIQKTITIIPDFVDWNEDFVVTTSVPIKTLYNLFCRQEEEIPMANLFNGLRRKYLNQLKKMV